VQREGRRITLVADGSLWREDLRIYSVTDLAVRLEEGGEE
jgi:hypothetical protein